MDALEALLDRLARWSGDAWRWAGTDLLVAPVLGQLALVAVVLAAAWAGSRLVSRRLRPAVARRLSGSLLRHPATVLLRAAPWLVALGVLSLAAAPLRQGGVDTPVVDAVARLVVAWVAIRTLSRLITNPALSRAMAVTAFAIVALEIVGLLEPAAAGLDRLAFGLGAVRLSALDVVEGLAVLVALLWLGRLVAQLVAGRLRRSTLTPAMQVLADKVVRVVLIVVAIAGAMAAVGIDLTAFAVFSGALGVGIGFGLQKVISNLISGFILLMDRSIKPGDVIQMDDTYGAITSLHARYVSVVTRDNTEYLIPNEDLITNRVINWSFSSDLVRLRVPIGISYESDVRKAMALCLEAAAEADRVVASPAPRCLMRGFGDSAIDLELRFWIRDPANGTKNVTSDILLGIWDRFRDEGIRIPFPQRDLHVKDVEAAPATDPEGRDSHAFSRGS